MKVEALVETAPFPECETTRASAQQVFLVRHVETDRSLSGHGTGVSDDVPLTEHARHTARSWRPVLARERFRLVLTSPLGRARATHGHVALFAHGHVFQVLAARWLGLPAFAGHHFLLDTATLNILSYDNGIPAIKRWNAPLGPPAEETLEDA
jgi:broad specificity phosphatase PhoE